MSDALNRLLDPEGWRMIRQHPMPFVTVVIGATALVGLSFWAAFDMRYGGVIDLQDRQIADYQEKLNVETPEQAKEQMDELAGRVEELQERLSRVETRRLSVEEKRVLRRELSPPSNDRRTVQLMADVRCIDCQVYLRDFLEVFRSTGSWYVNTPVSLFDGSLVSTEGLVVQWYGVDAPEDAQVIMRSLARAGLNYEHRTTDMEGPTALIVTVDGD